MENLKFLGLEDLTDSQKDKLIDLSTRYYDKIKILINDPEIIVHLKPIKSKGNQQHFFIKARITAPNLLFEAEQDDWDLNRTLHKVFNNLENEIRKKLKL